MRTTLDLPDDLLRKAKIAAVTSGITLKELISRALARELQQTSQTPAERRVKFPIIRSKRPGTLNLTDEDIRRIELEDYLRGTELPR
jgi:hypothetical protein